MDVAAQRFKPFLSVTCHVINQLPSGAGNNNEWVTVHRLAWQSSWGEPTTFALGDEGNTGARWLTLDAIVRRERAELAGGELLEFPSVLERLGIGVADWKDALRVTSRRFQRELTIMAAMKAEAQLRR